VEFASVEWTEKVLANVVIPVGIGLGAALVLLLARYYLFRWLVRLTARSRIRLDNIIIESLRVPTILWCIALGLMAGLEVSPLPPRLATFGTGVVAAVVILSICIVVANAAAKGLHRLAHRMQIESALTGLGTTLIKALIFTLGGLFILQSLGVSITPLVAALGIGGLAVSLATQDTLANLFAGVHILVEEPVRVGDYVRLDIGHEGYVTDVGWRSTRIRMLSNNMIIVPNAKLAQTILTNYHLPERRMSLGVPVPVSYAADPDHVEKVLLEEATRAAAEVSGLLADPLPSVRFIPGFGESSMNFTLDVQVGEFVDQYLVQHELRKRIFRRFRQEGIEIPLPQRVVHVRDGVPSRLTRAKLTRG